MHVSLICARIYMFGICSPVFWVFISSRRCFRVPDELMEAPPCDSVKLVQALYQQVSARPDRFHICLFVFIFVFCFCFSFVYVFCSVFLGEETNYMGVCVGVFGEEDDVPELLSHLNCAAACGRIII